MIFNNIPIPEDVCRIIVSFFDNTKDLTSVSRVNRTLKKLAKEVLNKPEVHCQTMIQSASIVHQQIGSRTILTTVNFLKIQRIDVNLLVKTMDEIIEQTKDPYFKEQFGVNEDKINWALVSLRYLLRDGPSILDELKEKLFSCDPYLYSKFPRKGIHKWELWGNCEDLCITVLRSDYGAEIPIPSIERVLISLFIEEFKDFFGEMGKKFTEVNQDYEKNKNYIDYQNKLCGLIEEYKSVLESRMLTPIELKKLAMKIKVPNTFEIVNSLLRAPVLFIQTYLLIKTNESDSKQKLTEFFNNLLNCRFIKAIENYYRKCDSHYLQKETWEAKIRREAIQKFGEQAVKDAEKMYDWNFFCNEFIEDDEILPPINARRNKAEWKREALPAYIEKSKNRGIWQNKVFYRNPAIMPYLPGPRYTYFDETVIEQFMDCYIDYLECEDRFLNVKNHQIPESR